ncbi:hypothetical protein NSE_0533 [Neorickettsia sennetsu str. Miyayama]|uniref:Uncharacterized protein n=1 Tax=Ehrlichia sennetsu (strain ATCC VR-367 / Miyayama) TaxID=222891 RepID=Q2GDN0_EHRS3|nr:hypothetical protein NSE_0533 [Neorickettsia sennetsu str. Miyayama]
MGALLFAYQDTYARVSFHNLYYSSLVLGSGVH